MLQYDTEESEDELSFGSTDGFSSDEEDEGGRAQMVTPPPPRFVTRSTVVIRPNGRSLDVDMRYGTIQVSEILESDDGKDEDKNVYLGAGNIQ